MTRQEAVNWLINVTSDIGKAEHRNLWHYEQALCEIKEMLEQSTIEPKRGTWYERYSHEDGERDGVRCSECGTYYYFDGQLMNYCPNCGADMREGEADD